MDSTFERHPSIRIPYSYRAKTVGTDPSFESNRRKSNGLWNLASLRALVAFSRHWLDGGCGGVAAEGCDPVER